MKQLLLAILMSFALLASVRCLDDDSETNQQHVDLRPLIDGVATTIHNLMAVIDNVKKSMYHISRQTMLQQFAQEENLRTDGDSGIRVVRGRPKGVYNYESHTHIGGGACSIHDHANLISTMGMGEVSVVMNGYYFRTRHNDYKLEMPSTTSTEYGATEPIPFPDVPPEVLAKDTLEEQISEMSTWFRAFQTQDKGLRDYTSYFKPVFCYMEGAWTLNKNLVEPFDSDRHHLEAGSWEDLITKVQFAAYSGVKNGRENWAYLPSKIMEIDPNTGLPVYAQWNYRILCHPINRDIPFNLMVHLDDLTFRVARGRTLAKAVRSRAARFQLYDETKSKSDQLLDEIFYEIPGKDNVIPRKPCQQMTFTDGPMYEVLAGRSGMLLNTCRYHRQYKFNKRGAMGLTNNCRGFNDPNNWVAQTNQPEVAPMTIKTCYLSKKRGKGGNRIRECVDIVNRFSYAFPLEIVYLTPLLTWNPYNFTIHNKTGIAAGSGQNGVDVPFSGVDHFHYYLTPAIFFKRGTKTSKSAADTSTSEVNVMDPQGQVRKVRASGTHIFLPHITGVGKVRLRYPIFPVNGEGSSVWKELNALKALIDGRRKRLTSVSFRMSWVAKDPPGPHFHEFIVTLTQYKLMLYNGTTSNRVITTEVLGHSHELDIRFNIYYKRFEYFKCDGSWSLCWDKHPVKISVLTDSNLLPQP